MNLKNVLEKNEDVQLVFNGVKKKDGQPDVKKGELVPALVFGVEEKKDPDDVKKKNLIPKKLDGQVTDVISTGTLKMLSDPDPTRRFNPMMGGISAANLKETAGSITGQVVYLGRPPSIQTYNNYGLWSWFMSLFRRRPVVTRPGYTPIDKYMLSNYHVFKGDNGNIGDYIIQPGPADLGKEPVGRLIDYVPLSKTDYNKVDAAICQLYDGNDILYEQCGIGEYNRNIGQANVGDLVFKWGRTTKLTWGKVEGIDGIAKVWYGEDLLKWEKQIVITNRAAGVPFSKGGDSGSMILNTFRMPVGLLYAGSDAITLANHIGNVAETLKISF